MSAAVSIESTQLVDEVMRRWPVTIRVFLSDKMRCVGCPIVCFHTIDDSCREHGTDRAKFLADLHAAISKEPDPQGPEPDVVMARWPAPP